MMNMTRYQLPAAALLPIEEWDREFNRVFESLWEPTTALLAPSSAALDLYESPEGYLARVYAPGYKKEELSVELRDGVLRISGAHKEEGAESSFERTVRLPAHADAAAIQARYENGVLEVRVGRKEETKPRSIAITVNE